MCHFWLLVERSRSAEKAPKMLLIKINHADWHGDLRPFESRICDLALYEG